MESPDLKYDSLPNMHFTKTALIKKRLKEDLVSFEDEERKFPVKTQQINRKTAPSFLKERRSMPAKGTMMILNDIDSENGQTEFKGEDIEDIEEKQHLDTSNDSSDSINNLSLMSTAKEEDFIKGYYSDSYLYKRSALSNSEKIQE